MLTKCVHELAKSRDNDYLVIAPRLDNSKFSSWRDRFLSHIVEIEPYIIQNFENRSYVPICPSANGETIQKSKVQWTLDERKWVKLRS